MEFYCQLGREIIPLSNHEICIIIFFSSMKRVQDTDNFVKLGTFVPILFSNNKFQNYIIQIYLCCMYELCV